MRPRCMLAPEVFGIQGCVGVRRQGMLLARGIPPPIPARVVSIVLPIFDLLAKLSKTSDRSTSSRVPGHRGPSVTPAPRGKRG
jgi:hypothetical protein